MKSGREKRLEAVIESREKELTWQLKRIETLEQDHDSLIDHVRVVLGAFDSGVFVRNTKGDGESSWAVGLLRPVFALSQLQIAATRKADNLG